MAILVNQDAQQNYPRQLIPSEIGIGAPIVAYDAIAVDYTTETIGSGSREETIYKWTPLSSYLGEMRTKIAKQQLFD